MTPNPDMQPAVTEALEPCPKCHSENVEFGGHGRGVYCVICKDCCIQTKFYQSRAAVAADWNTRHRSQETARSADIAQRLQDYMEQYHGVCLSASEWDAVAASVMARSTDVVGWRSMETAPKDGTRVLVCWDGDENLSPHVELGKWKFRHGWCNTYGQSFHGEPDRYMDLPDPSAPLTTPPADDGGLRSALTDDPDNICAGLSDEAIQAGCDAWEAANHEMANYISGVSKDWDDGMIVAAIFKAVARQALSRGER